MTYAEIYIICQLLRYAKGLVLVIQSFGISATQDDNNRITRRSLSEDPILMVPQKQDTSNRLVAMSMRK